MKLYFCAKSPFRNFKKFQSTLLKSFKYVLCRISSFSWGSHIKGIFIAITRLIIINFIDKQRHSWNRSRMRVMFGQKLQCSLSQVSHLLFTAFNSLVHSRKIMVPQTLVSSLFKSLYAKQDHMSIHFKSIVRK